MTAELNYHRLFSVTFSNAYPWPGYPGPRYLQTKDGGKAEFPRPSFLTIERFGKAGDFMLRFLDADGNEITHDHPHDLANAFDMAKQEFGIPETAWTTHESDLEIARPNGIR